jgi:hypothetical protein
MSLRKFWNRYTVFSRKIHRLISPLVAAQLLLSVTTGFLYMFWEKILGLTSPPIFMEIHQGKVMADWTRAPFTILYSFIIFLGVFSGIPPLQAFWKKNFWKLTSIRALHRFSATFMLAFYMVFAGTGVVYRNLREIFDIDKTYVKWLIIVHAAGYNKWTMIIYISTMTILTVLFTLSGCILLFMWLAQWYRVWRSKRIEVVDEEYANLEFGGGEVDLNESLQNLNQMHHTVEMHDIDVNVNTEQHDMMVSDDVETH